MLAIIQQGPRRHACFLDYFGKTGGHAGSETRLRGDWRETSQKVAIGGRNSSFMLATRFEPKRFGPSLTSRGVCLIASLGSCLGSAMTVFRLKQLASTSVHAAAG